MPRVPGGFARRLRLLGEEHRVEEGELPDPQDAERQQRGGHHDHRRRLTGDGRAPGQRAPKVGRPGGEGQAEEGERPERDDLPP